MSPISWVYGQCGAEPGAVLLENDKVIVRRYLLQLGMSTGMHTHSYDYLRVILQGGTAEVTALNGPSRTEEIEAGSVAWRAKTAHDTKNVGGSPIEGLVIEIK
jgi:quercetin dioxygenase-like cupin family protein